MSKDASVLSLHTSLLSAMLGASIGLAIDKGIADASAWKILAIVVLVLHAVNFYHGKTVGLFDANELIRSDARPLVRSTLILSNTLLFLVFCVMAARVFDARTILLGEIALRVIDIIVVSAQLRVFDRSPGVKAIPAAARDQLKYWQTVNVIVLLDFAAILLLTLDAAAWALYPLVVCVFSAFVLLDLAAEYTSYSANYFRSLSDWNELAERWDRLQGRYGDQFRTQVIHPFVEGWVRDSGAGGVVDLGAGNGCTARWLAEHLQLTVVAVERATKLIDLAQLYPPPSKHPIRYVAASIDAPSFATTSEVKEARASAARPLAFISLFAAQDCEDVQGFFATVHAMMRPGERLLIVFEAERSFDPNAAHSSTVRTWKYSWRRGERVQIVGWLPVHSASPTSLYANSGADSNDVISTITRHRSADDFAKCAAAANMRVLRAQELLLASPASTPELLAYSRAPKFEFMELELIASHEKASTTPAQPGVITGASKKIT